MAMIEDPLTGNRAGVTEKFRLKTDSIAAALQHEQAREGRAYQVQGQANLAAATVTPLFIQNDDAERDLVVTYIRHQIVDHAGGTALPNVSNYFSVVYGNTYTSGGTDAVVVNTNAGSSNVAGVTAKEGNPVLGGTARELDRWFTKAEADMNVYNKEGSLVIPNGQALALKYVGDHTSGIIRVRLSFIMRSITE